MSSAYRALSAQLRALHGSAWSEAQVGEAIARAATAERPPRTVRTYGPTIAFGTWFAEWWPALFERVVGRRMGFDDLREPPVV